MVAVGSFTVPVKAGVASLLNTSSTFTMGAVTSLETVPLAGTEVLPAESVAVAVTVSPLVNPPGLATVHAPVTGSVAAWAVLPSGKVTVTVEPGSAVPMIGSVALIGSRSGAFGAVV